MPFSCSLQGVGLSGFHPSAGLGEPAGPALRIYLCIARRPLNNEINEQVSGSDGTLRSAESTPTQAKEPATLHKIFIGEDGLRAGWSLLIFVALVMAIGRGANFILHRLHAPF